MEPGQKLLRIGDLIVIKGIQIMQKNQIIQNQQQQAISGFISCIGNCDNKVYFQQLPGQIMLDEFKIQETLFGDGAQLSSVRNYRDFIFQIWPRVNYEVHKSTRKLERQMDELQSRLKRQQSNSNMQEGTKNANDQQLQNEIESLEQQLKEMQKKLQEEWTTNAQILEKFLFKTVSYGTEIQLYHLDSRCFLNGRIYTSETEKSAYKFELSRSLSNGMIFKIEPKFKSKKMGEAVSYADRLLIKNEKLQCFLNFKAQQPTELDRPLSTLPPLLQQYPCPEFFKNDSKSVRYDIFLSQSSDIQWVFYKHGIPFTEEYKDRLRGGSLIRLRNTESDSLLSADIVYEADGQNPEVYLRKYNGIFDQESSSVSSLWEVECNTFQRRGKFIEMKKASEAGFHQPNNNEGEEQQEGAADYMSEIIRLRHFLTGNLLCVSTANLKGKGQHTILSLKQQKENPQQQQQQTPPTDITEVRFVPTKHQGQKDNAYYVLNNQCFILKVNEQYVKLNPENHDYFFENIVQIPGFYTRLSDKESNIERLAMEATKVKSLENAFWLEIVDQKEQEDLIFLRQSTQYLLRLALIFKSGKNKEELKGDFLQKCYNTLKNLIFFVLKTDDNVGEAGGEGEIGGGDPLTCEGICIENRQRMMKSFRFTELITDILYYPFQGANKNEFAIIVAGEQMKKILKLCYRLIKFMIREYRPNEVYASQWIDLFMTQAMTFDARNDILAEPTLTELIDNNRTVLETKINSAIIQKFIDLLITDRQTKYLKLLRALINCDGEAMINNQKLITQILLVEDQEMKGHFVIRPELLIPLRQVKCGGGQEDSIESVELMHNQVWTSLARIQLMKFQEQQEGGTHNSEMIQSMQQLQADKENSGDSRDGAKDFYEYFVTYIRLLADLCLERNFIAIDPLKEYIPFEMCFYIMNSSSYPYLMRSVFTEFFINCWVDGERLPKIKIPNYFRLWKDIVPASQPMEEGNHKKSSSVSIICADISTEKFLSVQEFITRYLMEATKNGYQHIQETEANEFTENVLKMCKLLVMLGVYKSTEDINALIKPLLLLLNASFDVSNIDEENDRKIILENHSNVLKQNISQKKRRNTYINIVESIKSKQTIQRYEQGEETKILTNCRQIILEILKICSKLLNDVRATHVIALFKKYMIEKQQLNGSNHANLNDQSDMQMLAGSPSKKPRASVSSTPQDRSEAQNLLKDNKIQPFSESQQGNGVQIIKNRSKEDEQIMFMSWLKQSVELQDIQIASQAPVNFTAILLDLLLYDNQDFLNFVFQNLYIQFAEIKMLHGYLCNIQIIEDEEKIQMLDDTHRIMNQLNDLADTAETWLTKNNALALGKTGETISCLEKLLIYLMGGGNSNGIDKNNFLTVNQQQEEDVKEQNNTNANVLEEIEQNNEGNQRRGQRQQQQLKKFQKNQRNLSVSELFINVRFLMLNINKEYQLLMKNFELYDPIMRILKFHIDIEKPEEEAQTTKLLQRAYKVLALFVFENQDNKQLMEMHLSFALKHLRSNSQSLAYLLIQELIRNNRRILYNHVVLERNILPALAKTIDSMQYSNVLKAMHLHLLKIFNKEGSKVLKNNQILLLTVIGNSNKFKNILLMLQTDKKLFEEFKSNCTELSKKLQSLMESEGDDANGGVGGAGGAGGTEGAGQANSQFEVPILLQYFITQLELLSGVCEDKNASTESKCQNYFKIPFLVELMKASDKCWPVRVAITQLFYNVYIEIEKEISDQGAFHSLLDVMNKDLAYIAKFYKNVLRCNTSLSTFKGAKTLRTILDEYLYYGVLQSFSVLLTQGTIFQLDKINSFYKMLCMSLVTLGAQTYTKQFKKYLAGLFRRIEGLENISKAINFKREVKPKIPGHILELMPGGLKGKIAEGGTSAVAGDLMEEEPEQNGGDQMQPSNRRLQRKNTQALLMIQQQQNNQQQPASMGQIFHNVIVALQGQSEQFQLCIEGEFEMMIQAVKDIEKITDTAFIGLNTLTFDSVCKKLVLLLDPEDEILKPDLSLIGLSVFRKIVEMENTKLQTPAAEWESEDYEPFSKQILFRQNQLVEFGVVKLVFNMFTLDVREDLKHEAILVAIAVLLGGNNNAQQAFYDLFQTADYKNTFMVRLKAMLDSGFQIVKKSQDRVNRIRLKSKKVLRSEEGPNAIEDKGEEDQEDEEEDDKEQGNAGENDVQGDDWEMEELVKIRRLYRFMQLLCEGHYSDMQNYFRKQVQQGIVNGKTINFLKLTVIQFGTFLRFLNVESISLGKQMINFLIESMQGPCVKNQESLANSKIVDFTKTLLQKFIKKPVAEATVVLSPLQQTVPQSSTSVAAIVPLDLSAQAAAQSKQLLKPPMQQVEAEQTAYADYIRLGFVTQDQRLQADQLVSISTKLLLSMVEANQDEKIAVYLSNQLDFDFIKSKLTDAYSNFVATELKLDPARATVDSVISQMKSQMSVLEGNIEESFSMYLLLVTLADSLKKKADEYGNPAADCLDAVEEEGEQDSAASSTAGEENEDQGAGQSDPKEARAMTFFARNTISIEAQFEEKLYKIFFPLHPACRNLSKQSRENIMVSVKRDSQNSKIQGLLGSIGSLFTEMEHLSYLRTLPVKVTSGGLTFLRNFSTMMAVIINLFLLATYDRVVKKNETHMEIEEWSVQTITVFGILQLVSSLLMLIFQLTINLPIIIRVGWDEYVGEHAAEVNDKLEERIEEFETPTKLSADTGLLLYALRVKGPYHKFFNQGVGTDYGSLFGKLFCLEKSMFFLLSNGSLQFILFYITCSVVGFFYADIFYSFQLLDIIDRFPLLRNVVQSITGNFNQIALTYFFGNIIMYIYSVLGFYFLAADYFNKDIGEGENMCTNLASCYLWTVQLGLRNGGGISESMTMMSDSSKNQDRYWFRFFFDVSFFILIQIIFLNIIFGIIIDTFAELRDEKSAMQEDMKNRCFICGLDRYTFEKNADGFENHIERDHQLWNYIYYIYYIQSKDQTDLNGIESYINRKTEELDVSWIPLMKALSIQADDQEQDEKEHLKEHLAALEDRVSIVKTQVLNLQ